MPTRRQNSLSPTDEIRQRVLEDFSALKIPLRGEDLDRLIGIAEKERLSHLQFVERLVCDQAAGRRERAVARRIREAHFHETKTLEAFDWQFNAAAIDRLQIQELASGDFIRRHDNLVLVGQSGVGKSHVLQGLGRAACLQGYRVFYTTSAELLQKLTASLADQTLPSKLRSYAKYELLIIDEFGFDRIERVESQQAASLLYKVIDARRGLSTALATNIDFDSWSDYLGDPPLAMAILDRIVDGAIILKINGKSYRAHRAKTKAAEKK